MFNSKALEKFRKASLEHPNVISNLGGVGS